MISGDTIIGIDVRPATGQLFGLGSGSRLYTIDPATGAATLRGTSTTLLNGASFGFDFNAMVDRIRVVSDLDQNIRLNPDTTAAVVDTPLFYDNTTADGDPIDPNAGVNPTVTASAYTNSFSGSTSTTLYGIDTLLNILVTQNPPNAGTLNTIGPLGNNPADINGFDIDALPDGSNLAFAALSVLTMPVAETRALYTLDLATGAASQVSPSQIGGASPVLLRGLAVVPHGTLQFSTPNPSQSEGGGIASITVFRNGGSEGTVTVRFTTSNGTATSPADFTDSDQTLTFADGDTQEVVLIPFNNDSLDEVNETINLTLSNPTGGAHLPSAQATAVLTIVDDDTAAIDVTKLTNGTNNNSAPGPSVPVGSTVTFTYVVSNAANDPLQGVAVRDDNGTGNLADDFNATFASGDGNGNGLLDPSETWIFNASRIATAGQHTNIAVASGTPTGGGAPVQDSDADNHFGVASPTPTPTPSPTPTVTPSPSPTPQTVLGNISTRLRVEIGDDVLIAGMIVSGNQDKRVIIRGTGTSLAIADKLQDPILELHGPSGLIEANDNWVDSPNKQAIMDSGVAPSNDLEPAIIATLPANNSGYTAILRGVNNGTGIGVIEAYDLDTAADSTLANISTRGLVQTGDNVLFAGTIVVGPVSQKVIVRAIGPSLSVPGKMDDPTLELRDQNGGLLEENDNWVDSPNMAGIIASTIPPTNDKESAIVRTLPGNNAAYTAIVRGVNNSTGIALVEVYALEN
jgi:hypothetical protein